ncbi:MAG: hypothetical protein IKE58_09790 [Blautia sp.]|nr:hypothetical protein [Blautia sp.]
MKNHTEKWPYEDIVDLPHHVSKKHPQMPMIKRAAQFAPFAALTGYEDAVEETARLTEEKVELEDSAADELNRKIHEAVRSGGRVTITYFVPDKKKSGGAYVKAAGRIKKAEMGRIVMGDGLSILAGSIREIEAADSE